MAIRVKCGQCQAQFVARVEMAGKRGKCPKCQAPITVPRPAAPPTPAGKPVNRAATASADAAALAGAGSPKPRPANTPRKPRTAKPLPAKKPRTAKTAKSPRSQRDAVARELLSAFTGDIRRVRVPLFYRLGILITAVVMVLLPCLYVALIGLAGYGVYYHASHHTGLLEMGTGRARIFAVLIYVGPMVAGGIIVLFMLKPLLAQPSNQGRTRSLTRGGEPLLFSFVDRICRAVGAREPARIEVDYQMNASASFDSTALKLVRNRLVLTIGVPLVAGLNTAQFAGVLAHEFGHFTQGAGLRVTYVIRSINHWFLRVVYQRDAWDEWLEETAGELDFRIGWMLLLGQLGVLISRGVLWVLMMLGHFVGSFMLRQMEFHADAHEARLVGAGVFESTTRQLARLDVAQQAALNDIGEFLGSGRIPDDLAMLVALRCASMPPDLLAKLDEYVETGKTGWFDSHPAPRARIRYAAKQGKEHVFASERPAVELFSDFRALSRNITADLYRAHFGSRFQPSLMHPTEELLNPRPKAVEPPREIEI
ncbi:MAG: hypothetical protein DWQ37_10800 [Planctomycetota bacterium]|nr:MAG: hypothetical protein DWQ37_10800 [Planctomycetota bacterium]